MAENWQSEVNDKSHGYWHVHGITKVVISVLKISTNVKNL